MPITRSLRSMGRPEASQAPSADGRAEGGSRPNRRRNPRVRVNVAAGFELEGAPARSGRAVSYSESGVFVATMSPPPQGSWVVLRFLLFGEIFEVEALVVRVVAGLNWAGDAGFGAEFVALPPRLRTSFVRLLVLGESDMT